MVVDTGAQ